MQQPNSRLLTIDVGRGLAVFFLVWVHAVWMYLDPVQAESNPLASTVKIMGNNTSAFLLLMGISLAIARPKSFGQQVKRACLLIATGYWMNFLKFIVPIYVFETMPESFISAYGWSSPLTVSQGVYLWLTGDILQLAGLVLLLISVVNVFTLRSQAYFMIALCIAFASAELKGLKVGILGIDYCLDLLWSTDFNVYFPVFPWAVPVCLGMYLGRGSLERRQSESELYNKGLWLGLALIVVGLMLCWYDADNQWGDFFHTGPGGILLLSGLNMPVLWLLHQWIQRFPNALWVRCMQYLSYRVTSFYVIQWVLVCWCMGLVGYHQLSMWQVTGMAILLFCVSVVVQNLWDQLKQRLNGLKGSILVTAIKG